MPFYPLLVRRLLWFAHNVVLKGVSGINVVLTFGLLYGTTAITFIRQRATLSVGLCFCQPTLRADKTTGYFLKSKRLRAFERKSDGGYAA